MKAKLRELLEELRAVFAGRSNLADSVIPPARFLILNPLLSFDYAVGGSLLAFLLRLTRRQCVRYALGGLGGVILALIAARLLNGAEAYLLPAVITGALTAVVCGASAVVGRSLAAWTSHLVRRWPLGWRQHPRVRRVCTEVTIAWTVFFAAKLASST